MRYQKEERWEMVYVCSNGEEKVCYPRSKETVEKNKAFLREKGLKLVSLKKLYPFNTYANQHNFELIYNICFNRMCDMESGEIPYDEKEYDELEKRRDRAGEFRILPLPVAWLPYEDWAEAKEMATAAIIHRGNACIAAGRPDLVQYC